MLTRGVARQITDYADRIYEGDFPDHTTIPVTVLRAVSAEIDRSCERAHERLEKILDGSLIIQRAVRTLKNGPRSCGGFRKPRVKVLDNCTPYEQMSAFAAWMRENGANIRAPHTMAFISKDDQREDQIVPIWVKKPANGRSTLMTTIIGATTGKLRAPKYEEWAQDEGDLKLSERGHLVDPLTCLEIQRQPYYLGSLLLRASAYDANRIDNDWRFGTINANGSLAPEASVEHKKQNQRRIERIKSESAAYNLFEMINSPSLRDRNLLQKFNYEDLCDEGYRDYAEASITPLDLFNSFESVLRDDRTELDRLCEQLFAARLSRKSTIAAVQEYTSQTLFGGVEE